jgi:hypothetical protein
MLSTRYPSLLTLQTTVNPTPLPMSSKRNSKQMNSERQLDVDRRQRACEAGEARTANGHKLGGISRVPLELYITTREYVDRTGTSKVNANSRSLRHGTQQNYIKDGLLQLEPPAMTVDTDTKGAHKIVNLGLLIWAVGYQ